MRTYDPDVIVVYIGSNDIDNHFQHRRFFYIVKDNMKKLGERLQGYTTNRRAEVIYMTIEQRAKPRGTTRSAYKSRRNRMNVVLRNSREMNLCFNFQSDAHFAPDGIHFNQEDYREMANRILAKVEAYAYTQGW